MHNRKKRIRVAALATALLAAPAAAQYTAVDVVRVSGDVERERDGQRSAVQVADTIEGGDRIRTGADARVALQLAPIGLLTLGADGEVLLHSVEAIDPPARAGLARVVVERGTLRIDARPKQQLPPADLRVNVGTLRLRVFGAEAWIARSSGGDEVCLLSGAVELQTPEGPQRLDQPGSCLRASRSGLALLDPPSVGGLAPRLAHTAFPGDPATARPAPPKPVQTTEADETAAAAEASQTPDTPAATVADTSATTAQTVEMQAPGGTAGSWTIVLASLPEASRAEQEAARLRASGIDVRVIETQRADGSLTYRIVSGRYATKADAAGDIRALRARRGLKSAWVTQAQ